MEYQLDAKSNHMKAAEESESNSSNNKAAAGREITPAVGHKAGEKTPAVKAS